MTPREAYKAIEEPVDVKNFSIWEKIKQNARDVEKHPKMSANYVFNFLAFVTFVVVWHRMIRKPVEWYYDFADPFEGLAQHANAEHTLERLKYKHKISRW